MKLFSKWRPSAILNFRKLLLSSRGVCQSTVLLVYTKYRVNRKITGGDIARRRFSIWQLSARFEFHIFFYKSAPDRSWNNNLSLHTKFHRNWMIPGWDIAIIPFTKWRPSAILNFQNLVFWSRDLCLNVIMLLCTRSSGNRTINRWDIAKNDFRYGGRPPFWICAKFRYFVRLSVLGRKSASVHQI